MENTSSSNTTVSHIYVNLEQISFYEEFQGTEVLPIYKLEISNFWRKFREDNPIETGLIKKYEAAYSRLIENWDYSPPSSYLLYMGDIIPIPQDFSKAILKLLSRFAITIISAKELERLSLEPYYSNKPYFCKLTFSDVEIENDNVNFVFNRYFDTSGIYSQFRKKLIENWNQDSDSYIILTKNSENSSTTDLNILFPLNILYEKIPDDIEYGNEPIFSEGSSYAESLIDLGFIISNNEIERSGYEFNSEDPIATTILFSTDPEENIELKETKNQVFLMDDSKRMTTEQINNQGTPSKDPFTPHSSPARPNTDADTISGINESAVQKLMGTPISGKQFAKINRFLHIKNAIKSNQSPQKINPNQSRPLNEYIGSNSKQRPDGALNEDIGSQEELTSNPKKLNIMLKILTQGEHEEFVNNVFKNVERCPNNIKRTLIKEADGGSTYMKTEIQENDSGNKTKIIKIIFEHNSVPSVPNSEWITLRTYLYRLFISDTLHDFYDKSSSRVHTLTNDPNNNANFLRFYQNYIKKFMDIFPEIQNYDNEGNYRPGQQFNNLKTIVNDNDLENVANTLESLKKKTYTKFLLNDLKKEGKKLQEFNNILQILERNEQGSGGYFAKPMVTDADNKSLKYFAILNEYYEQKQKKSEQYSLDSKGPLIYLKTLSHELDQATTPKIERVLKSINLDYFDRGTVTHLAAVPLATNEECKTIMNPTGNYPPQGDGAAADDAGVARRPAAAERRQEAATTGRRRFRKEGPRVGDTIRRRIELPGASAWADGKIIGYLGPDESDFVNEKGVRAALYLVRYESGLRAWVGEDEELEEWEIKAWPPGGPPLDEFGLPTARRSPAPAQKEDTNKRALSESDDSQDKEDELKLNPKKTRKAELGETAVALDFNLSPEASPAPASAPADDSSPEMRGGQDGIEKNLYSVQVQMIKMEGDVEKLFLDYEILREFTQVRDDIITIKEGSFFNLSLIHHFATEALEISLKDNVGTEKVKKWKGSILNKEKFRAPVGNRTTRRGSTSQNVKSVKTPWWSNIKNLTQKSVINDVDRKTPLPSTAAFVLECIEFCRKINKLKMDDTSNLGGAFDPECDFGPGNVMKNIIILMFHSSNTNNYESWKEVIINRIATYRDYWWDEVGNQEISNKAAFCERMLSKISRLTSEEINDKQKANKCILKLLYILGNDISSEWTEHYVTFTKKCKLKNMSIDKSGDIYSLKRTSGTNDIDIDVKINNVLGHEYNTTDNWFKKMRSEIGSLSSSSKKEDEDESSSSFGVSKLIKWMFSANELNVKRNMYNEDYTRLERPVILKMIMDSFHYINLLENKLQVESRTTLTAGQKILPIMHTMDLNCGYLCGFFTDKILNSIEFNRNYDSVVSPKTIINDDWKKMLEEQQYSDKVKAERDAASRTASRGHYSAPMERADDKLKRDAHFFGYNKGGSVKTRRRGDKIKSNGKITRRKPI